MIFLQTAESISFFKALVFLKKLLSIKILQGECSSLSLLQILPKGTQLPYYILTEQNSMGVDCAHTINMYCSHKS